MPILAYIMPRLLMGYAYIGINCIKIKKIDANISLNYAKIPKGICLYWYKLYQNKIFDTIYATIGMPFKSFDII